MAGIGVAPDGILRVPCKTNMSPRVLVVCFAVCSVVGLVPAFAQTQDPPKFTGPGSCASPSCHGSVTIKTDTAVMQNEYSTWVVKDKHSGAFAVLSNDVAKRISRLMDLKEPQQEPRCLGCHSLNPPNADRARSFDASDGVSCESCHGPASNWLGPHTTGVRPGEKSWTHEQSVNAGMRDLRDLGTRTEQCLTCHIGTKDYAVDHELIAAGHPDLYFELDSFMAAMPTHWKEMPEKPNATPDPYFSVRALAVSQAVDLRDQLRRVVRNAQTGVWPEYADLECYACHHSLTTAANSWQQKRGYPALPDSTSVTAPAAGEPGRRPGNPPFNISRYVVLRQVVNEMDAGAGRELADDIDRLYASITSLKSDRAQVATLAASTADLAGRLVPRLTAASYDQPGTLRLMKAILNSADYITRQGERPAEQAAMAVQSLYVAYSAKGKPANDAAIQGALSGLFKQMENPSSYDAFKFADQMRALDRLLP